VSLPCWELFEEQDQSYRDEVLPPAVRKRVAIEVGVSLGWERWVGDEGAIIGLDHFGASAPAATIFEHFGFTPGRVAEVASGVVAGTVRGRIPTSEPGHLPATVPGRGPSVTGAGTRGAHDGTSDRGRGSGVERSSGRDPGHS
jgi:hypothetical protein